MVIHRAGTISELNTTHWLANYVAAPFAGDPSGIPCGYACSACVFLTSRFGPQQPQLTHVPTHVQSLQLSSAEESQARHYKVEIIVAW